jgi:hypothetical protein
VAQFVVSLFAKLVVQPGRVESMAYNSQRPCGGPARVLSQRSVERFLPQLVLDARVMQDAFILVSMSASLVRRTGRKPATRAR